MFDALGISSSGLLVHRKWLDAVSDNMANINTVTSTDQDAFQERLIVAQAVDYGSGEGGVEVARTEFGSAEGRLVYEPGNPLADSEGYVRYPDIDLGDQMVQLLMAQRGYQANLAVVERATNAYQAALQLGEGLTMTSPIGGISFPVMPTPGVTGITGTEAASAAVGTQDSGFAAVLASSVDQLQATQSASDSLATQAATGDLRDVHDYMIAANEAKLATEMVVTVKNKAVEAFNEIMRMPV